MEFIIISLTALLVSILTFFSGFGLGTILTPVFMIFFPVDLAIGCTGIIHFFNYIFKLFLVRQNVNKEVLIKFGVPAILGAILGSYLLIHLSDGHSIFSYHFFGRMIEGTAVKLLMSILLILFVCVDIIPYFKKIEFGKDKLPIGGFLSGFFGGLSGVQGAMRSAFLIKADLSKEAFISTAVVISTFVDFTRLSIYATHFSLTGFKQNTPLIICATFFAMVGSFIGNRLLKKVTIQLLQTIIAVMLILISIALGLGLI